MSGLYRQADFCDEVSGNGCKAFALLIVRRSGEQTMPARVLVVDDLVPNVKLLSAKLQAEYFDVMTASSGPEALEKIAESPPDLILLDVMMPGMDGFEVCRRLKSDPEDHPYPDRHDHRFVGFGKSRPRAGGRAPTIS